MSELPRNADGHPRDPTDGPPPAVPEQVSLPFGADAPIPFALTARARRVVDPDGVPDLRVVDGGLARPLDDGTDTRRARARALRHAGVAIEDIATSLGVDEVTVRAWSGDVAVSPRAEALRPVRVAVPADLESQRARRVFEDARAGARASVADRLAAGDEGVLAIGLALLAGALECTPHAAVLTATDPRLAAAALRWLADEYGLDLARVRIVLQLGADVAADAATHRWADALGVAPERVVHTRWRRAPAPDAVQALVRIADPGLSAALAGAIDALLTTLADAAHTADW